MLTHEEELARRRRRYAEHREEERARRRERYVRNREAEREAKRRWYEANKEKISLYNKTRYQKQKEKIAEQHRQAYLRNREKYIEYSRQWRLAHPEAHRLHIKRWHDAHREEIREAAERRRDETAFFQGLAMASAIAAADQPDVIERARELSEEKRIERERRKARAYAWKQEWARRNPEKTRLYRQRWKERLMADPERLEAFRKHERERRKLRGSAEANHSTNEE